MHVKYEMVSTTVSYSKGDLKNKEKIVNKDIKKRLRLLGTIKVTP